MKDNDVNSNNSNNLLTIYESNELLRDLPKILNQMKNIIIANNNNLNILQSELKKLKYEQDKFKKDITRALNIINDKFSAIDDLEENLTILEEIFRKKISDLEDEINLNQQISTKSLNEILKLKDLFKI